MQVGVALLWLTGQGLTTFELGAKLTSAHSPPKKQGAMPQATRQRSGGCYPTFSYTYDLQTSFHGFSYIIVTAMT